MLSIVLPCYNEAENIPALMERLDLVAANYANLEIILVNNGSTDNSADIFESALKSRNTAIFKVVTVEKNIGYGFGILSGLRAAKGDILSVTHADRQTDPMDVLKAEELFRIDGGNCLVKGHRKNRRLGEAFFSFGMGVLASLVLGVRLTEINAQPKLFSKMFFNEVEKQAPNDFALDLYFLYQAKLKSKIISFPVYFAKRVAGEAKGGSGSSFKVKLKLIKRSWKYIFELKKAVKK